jgi:hypothetical protein
MLAALKRRLLRIYYDSGSVFKVDKISTVFNDKGNSSLIINLIIIYIIAVKIRQG